MGSKPPEPPITLSSIKPGGLPHIAINFPLIDKHTVDPQSNPNLRLNHFFMRCVRMA